MSQRKVAVACLIAAAFLLTHPYTGVRHDGTLYLGDALSRLLPSAFKDDPYFFFGSQGRFTLLPALYSALVQSFGLGPGAIVGMLIAFALYLSASWYLVSTIVPQAWRRYAMLSVLLGWTLYGGQRVFGYSEPFLTARSFAEPVTLFALALLLRGKRVAAAAALILALFIHPLIALGGWLVAWIILSRRDRRWLWLGVAGVALLVVLGIVGREPFSDLFAVYDAEWLALVHEANSQAFVLAWALPDYGVIVFDTALLYFVLRLATARPLRELAIASLVVGLGSTLLSLGLVDLIGSTFFGKVQLWRAQWIMQWVAMAALPFVLLTLWRQPGNHGRLAACFLAIGWMATFNLVAAPLGLMAVAVDATRARTTISATTTKLVGLLVFVIAATICIQFEARVFKFGTILDQPLHLVIGQALSMNLLVLGILVGLFLLLPRMGSLVMIVGVAALALSLWSWDQRGAWTRKLESYAPGAHIWPGLIDPAAKVYWYRDLIAPWVLLGHANYYTAQQSSGSVFSRGLVVELERRRSITALLDFQEQVCRLMNGLSEKQGSCEPDATAVKQVCIDGQIDYVVLQSSLEGARPLADFSTGVVENGYEKKFFLYRCSALNP